MRELFFWRSVISLWSLIDTGNVVLGASMSEIEMFTNAPRVRPEVLDTLEKEGFSARSTDHPAAIAESR